MKIVEAVVKSSDLVYPEGQESGYVKVVPYYKTIVTLEEGDTKKEFTINDRYVYFDVGSKIKVRYDGNDVKIEEIQHEIPHEVTALVELGRKHAKTILLVFIISLIWMIVLGTKGSKLAILPFTLFIPVGIMNIINFNKTKVGIIVKSNIKDILRKMNGENAVPSYYYLYEYSLNGKKCIYCSFKSGAKNKNLGSDVNLIFNEQNNLIIEQNGRTPLLLQGLLGIIVGILVLLFIFL